MKKINDTTVEVMTANRGLVLISLPFIAYEIDGETFDVAPKTKEGLKYLLMIKRSLTNRLGGLK